MRKSLENKNFNKFSLAGKFVGEANKNRKSMAFRTIGNESRQPVKLPSNNNQKSIQLKSMGAYKPTVGIPKQAQIQ